MSNENDPLAWVERAEEDYAMVQDDLSILLSYAVRVRYPGEDPTPEEAREALDIARSVRRVARKFLSVE
jgi:hypothetical protein